MIDEGAGFPTFSRVLARRKINTNDPNGYYAFLGISPDAPEGRIRKRCRYLLRRFHPDGSHPDRAKFARTLEIRNVLLDPERKAYYDHTPLGNKFVDETLLLEIKEQIERESGDPEAGRRFMESLTTMGAPFFSYSVDGDDLRMGDRELAQDWYRVLLHVGYFLGLQGRIRVRLTDHPGTNPFEGEEVSVPRDFPTVSKAVELLSNRKAVVPAC